MKLRHIVMSILALATISLSPLALADDLTIYNNTDFPSTTIANNGACSSEIISHGEHIGITKPHSVNIVPAKIVSTACMLNKENCDSRVYLTANCKGDVIANVLFSVSTGIKNVTNSSSDYCVKGSGFTVIIDRKDSENCK